ncbi:MAG: hypothetical protein LUD72_12770 [Bacteroidales bacterium]|nr:hypothetical protein [Bacteroidales bacterium]
MAEEFSGRVVADTDDGSITVTMPKKAIVKKTDETTVLSVPRGQGYDGYRYEVDSERVTELEDGNISVAVTDTGEFNLEIKRGEDVRSLKTGEIVDMFANASDEDFGTKWVRCEVPTKACVTYATSTRVRMPDNSEFSDKFTFIANKFKKEDSSDSDVTVFSVPDTWELSVGTKEGESAKINPETLKGLMKNAEYKERGGKWERIDVPEEARSFVNEGNSRFNMPKGEYEGKSYYLPNGMIRTSENAGCLTLILPKDVKLIVVGEDKERNEISLEDFKAAVAGRKKEDYPVYRKETKAADNKAAEKKFQDEQSL